MRVLVISGLLIVFLAGCTVGPDYVRPGLDVPTSFIHAEGDARETANTDWWRQFQDPVLDQLIAEALANNRDIKIAAAHIEQAAAVLIQARAPLFPQLGYGGEGRRERISGSRDTPPVSYTHLTLPTNREV